MARDYAYEALAEVSSTDQDVGRGQLNAALRDIRKAANIPDGYLLGVEIHRRAKLYREIMPDIILTPTSLAKHWDRVQGETDERSKVKGTNLSAVKECPTCGGDRFVVVSLRKPVTSQWMIERGIKANEDHLIEEMAPCPDCGPEITGVRVPDPARVREMMRR